MHQDVTAWPTRGQSVIVRTGAYTWRAVALGTGDGATCDVLLIERSDGATCASGLPARILARDLVEVMS